MSVSITSYPDKVLNTDPSEISKWNAVFQPIKFAFQRKDFIISTCSNSSGKVKVNWFADEPREISVGDDVYVRSGQYDFTGTVLSIDPGETFIVVDKTFNGNSVGGYCNAMTGRPNYFISVKIYTIINTTYTYLGVAEPKPNTKGAVDLDLSPFIRSRVSFKNTNTYDQINKAYQDMGGRFNIIYKEQWDGNEDDDYTDFTNNNIRYWVAAAKQIQSPGGFNMSPYVTFPPDSVSPLMESSKAKFMSDFERPTYFVGYPFDLSFIYSENVSALGVYRKEIRKDLNGQELSNDSSQLLPAEAIMPNGLCLSGEFLSTVKTVDVYLECDPDVDVTSQYDTDEYDVEDFDIPVPNTTQSFTFEPPVE